MNAAQVDEPQVDDEVAVRRRVFRQLLESLVYEGVVCPEVRQGPGPDRFTYRLQGHDHGVAVAYTWCAQRRFGFGRLRLSPSPVQREATAADGSSVETEATSLAGFLRDVASSLRADPGRLAQFATELDRTVANDTMARRHWRRLGRHAREASYDELESLVIDGHLYHPSYKSRIGFDATDNAAFGPEFAMAVRPVWVALHQDVAWAGASSGIDHHAFVAAELGDETYAAFRSALAQTGHHPDHYHLLPVHPWQWRTQIATGFLAELGDASLVPLGIASDEYRAQQSLRTLANLTHPRRASLKLSLSILTTSTVRTLAPHSVLNAPIITDWLRAMIDTDRYLSGELQSILLGEVAGVAYHPGAPPGCTEAPESTRATSVGLLSAIWRESLHRHLQPGEAAAPFTALCHIDAHGEPFVARWIADQGVEPWVRQLLEVAIAPVVHLLCAHGVALGAHAQNLILIHADGQPRRLALRDVHDIRFSPAHLARPEACPRLHPTPAGPFHRNYYLEAETPEEVRDFVHDAFFFVNLSELAMFLDDHFGLSERQFWSIARQVIVNYQRRFPQQAKRYASFDLLGPTVHVEQLTTRRLLPDIDERLHAVPNPLGLLAGHHGVPEASAP